MTRLEIACFNASSALHASRRGAHRIELCTNQSVGGLTPPLSLLLSLRNHTTTDHLRSTTTPTIQIPIYVMIRPRGGDFVYSAEEFAAMETSMDSVIFHAPGKGADGFVFGILEPDGTVDHVRCGLLIARAKAAGKKCTFHRAFDAIPVSLMLRELDKIMDLGFASVLTSGGEENAVQGRGMLRKLVQAAKGRIEVIAGGGVRSGNVEALVRETSVGWVHSSAVVEGVGGTYSGGEGGQVASKKEIGMLVEIVDRL